MKLWTCQDDRLNITDGTQRVESKCSVHQGLQSAYEQLYDCIGHNQFHWYYTDKETAVEYGKNELAAHQRRYQLWEVEVAEADTLRMVCPTTWAWILEGKCDSVPPYWEEYWNKHLSLERTKEEFGEEFNRPWEHLTREQLWDRLFVDSIVPACTQVLLCHPVDRSKAMRLGGPI